MDWAVNARRGKVFYRVFAATDSTLSAKSTNTITINWR